MIEVTTIHDKPTRQASIKISIKCIIKKSIHGNLTGGHAYIRNSVKSEKGEIEKPQATFTHNCVCFVKLMVML